ncbi:Rrf2 family transcriptional regulator [Myxococcota bacterium]|nr:Rrf2 family transcriptional regulator [Myxococcota bacterium]
MTPLSPGLPLTSRYALAAVIALARLPPGTKESTQSLAERTSVPPSFLSKVLGQLARAGIVSGLKGHGGGYELARDPEHIFLGEVLDALGDAPATARPCVMGDRICDERCPCALHDRWASASAPLAELLQTVTVGAVARTTSVAVPALARTGRG